MQPATIEAEGLYAYTTPFASPRWLRLQQDGDDLWGTIDINGPFGFCARTDIVGWVSGDAVTFDVDLESTPCPCSGTTAALRFTGTMDGEGNIAGTWSNNCTPPTGSWWACRLPDPPQDGVCEPLPDDEPPYPVAQVPAAAALGMAALAFALTGWAVYRRLREGGTAAV